MHPHSNPIYKERLSAAFRRDYITQKLTPINDPIEHKYTQHISKNTRKLFGVYFAGLLMTIFLDRRYFSKFTEARTMIRVTGSLACISLVTSAGARVAFTPETADLTYRLALKYENQLLSMHPELQSYYQQSLAAQYVPPVQPDQDPSRPTY